MRNKRENIDLFLFYQLWLNSMNEICIQMFTSLLKSQFAVWRTAEGSHHNLDRNNM